MQPQRDVPRSIEAAATHLRGGEFQLVAAGHRRSLEVDRDGHGLAGVEIAGQIDLLGR